MELLDQHAKKIMEGCKKRARDAGLKFDDETLEYIVTNRDMIELSPKVMIPTLYDYWVHDVRVLSGKGKYELYPGNPYETVINTRPAISFYNDNNPDWLNVMIFYHVLGHIDFFQNNLFFCHTWNYDFTGQALADKRVIAKYRSEKGRWVDYVIEFVRGIDNITGYHNQVAFEIRSKENRKLGRIDYYFDIFLQQEKKVQQNDYLKEIERYNKLKKEKKDFNEDLFFIDVIVKYPEFEALYKKKLDKKERNHLDVIEYIIKHSSLLKKEENQWIKSVMEIVRNTSLFFQPQIRTKIINEGWASFWHETLFMEDDRIKGHEADFAKINAGVTAMPKVGLNPYALGMRLLYHIKDMGDRGCYSWQYLSLFDEVKRKKFDNVSSRGRGMDLIFAVREKLCDFTFINQYIDQDFVNKHKLFVSGKRINRTRMSWEYYVKSKKAGDYRDMIIDTLYHPPSIHVDNEKTKQGPLYLVHEFEGKPLKTDFIENTMMG
ncbi:MAG: SpoVR family protein, partial [Thermodesulfobacteriota bacterium]|nr:SpoVR family protein [Thermodesulfobacteriota bacterium]